MDKENINQLNEIIQRFRDQLKESQFNYHLDLTNPEDVERAISINDLYGDIKAYGDECYRNKQYGLAAKFYEAALLYYPGSDEVKRLLAFSRSAALLQRDSE